MTQPKRQHIAFKTIASLVAAIFLWNQLAWAGDLYNPIDKLNEDQSQQFAPDYLKGQQTNHENQINQMQDIEDSLGAQDTADTGDTREPGDVTLKLRGPKGGGLEKAPLESPPSAPSAEQQGAPAGDPAILSITTEAGDVIHYRGGEIESIEVYNIENSEYTVIRRIKDETSEEFLELMDANNNLLNADVIYSEGTTQEVRDGKVKKITKPDKTEITYNDDENIASVKYPDSPTLFYSYITDVDGEQVTMVADTKHASYYDSENRIKRVNFNTEKAMEYDNGMLSEAIDEGGKVYKYTKTLVETESGIEYVVQLSEIIDTYGNSFIVEMEGNNIAQVRLAGDLNFDNEVNSKDIGILTSNWGLRNRTYSQGDMDGDGRVGLSDHTILKNNLRHNNRVPVAFPGDMFDADGSIKADYDFSNMPYFNTLTYNQDNSIKEILNPNDDIVIYEASKNYLAIETGGTLHAYNISDLGNVTDITIYRDGIKRIYNEYGNLQTLDLDSETKIIYENDQMSYVEKTDGESGEIYAKIKGFQYGTEGNIIAYEVMEKDGSTTSYKNGLIDHKVNLDGTILRYVDGRIDRAENADGKVYKYIYEEDPAGNLINIRKELIEYKLENGTVLRLNNCEIVTIVLPNGIELVNPHFFDDKLVSAEFTLEDGTSGIIDNGGISKLILRNDTEIFYKNNLIDEVIESNGSVLTFDYIFDTEGEIDEIKVMDNGYEKSYDKNGVLKTVESNDRLVIYENETIKSIFMKNLNIFIIEPVFSAWGKMLDGVITLENGDVYTFEGGKQILLVDSDGVEISYDTMGYTQSIIQDGIEANYIYTRKEDGNLDEVHVRHNTSGEFVIESLISYLRNLKNPNQKTIVNRLPSPIFSYRPINTYTDSGSIEAIERRSPMADDRDIRCEVHYSLDEQTTDMVVFTEVFFGWEDYTHRLINIGIRKDANTIADVPIQVEFYHKYQTGAEPIYEHEVMHLSDEWQEETIILPPSFRNHRAEVVIRIADSETIPHDGTFYLSRLDLLQIDSLIKSDISWKDGSLGLDRSSVLSYVNEPQDGLYSEYVRGDRFFAPLNIVEFYNTTPLYALYNSEDKLQQIKRTNGSVVNFSDSKPDNMIEPNGEFIDYIYEGVSLKRAMVFPEEDLTNPDVILEYEGNKIKEAVKGDITYTYTYEDNSDGEEVTIVKNEATNYIYKYLNNQLLCSISEDGLITEYFYLDGVIDNATVRYQDNLLETFRYEYAGDLTIVIGEKGIKRTYDTDNRLVFLETADGLGYTYNYLDDGQGTDVLEIELRQAYGKDGMITYYKDGNIDYIQLKDGTVLVLNDSGSDKALQNMTINDGLVISIVYETGEIATYLRDRFGRLESIKVEKDGITRWYSTDGELMRLQKQEGEYYLYGYTRNENGSIDKVKVSKITYSTVGGDIPPAKFYAYSAGYEDGWDAGIMVDDKGAGVFNTNWQWKSRGEGWTGRGYDVAVIDGQTGKVKRSQLFDVWDEESSDVNRMAAFIEAVDEGDYVIMAIGDEGYMRMNGRAYAAIESIGSTMIRDVRLRDSWAIIGRKGAEPGTAIEEHNPRYSGPVVVKGYEMESFYYDNNGEPIAFDQFHDVLDTTWFSTRPTHVTDEIEIFAMNSNGDASGYIKNFNPFYADSGFIRIWDEKYAVYDETRAQELHDLVGDRKHKAVYYDPEYPTVWTRRDFAEQFRDFFEAKGYSVLNANELRQWLNVHGPDSVVIMAQDVAPATIINKYTAGCAARTYLENAGTMVWMHDIPFYYIGQSDGSRYELGEIGQKRILGTAAALEHREGDRYTQEDSVVPMYEIPGNQEEINLDFLQFDFSVNYRDIDWHKIKTSIGYELREDTVVVSEYGPDGELLSIAKADRTVSVYEDGKVGFVTDIHGDIIVDYTYDAEGNIIRVEMLAARRDAEYKVEEVKNQIAEQKALQLEDVAIQETFIIEQIKEWAVLAKMNLQGQREQKKTELEDLENKRCWWASEKRRKSIRMDQTRAHIAQIDAAIRQVDIDEVQKLEELGQAVKGASEDIEESAKDALLAAETEKTELLKELALLEAKPIVLEYYREILGRDPGIDEMENHMSEVRLSSEYLVNIDALKNYLYNTDEYIERNKKVGEIRGEIEAFLDEYVSAGDTDKRNLLSSSDLFPDSFSLEDTVTLSEEDKNAIVAWLEGQNIHFGRSAANILSDFLNINRSSQTYWDILEGAILVDILTGTINKFSGGNLEISAYALQKIASRYNLDLYPVQITFEMLKEELVSRDNGESLKVAVLLGGNHYVIVTGIDENTGKIAYIETSKGPDGEEVSILIEEFKDAWKGGYAITQQAPADDSVVLTDYQAQKVKGACLPFLLPLVGLLFSFGAVAIQTIVVAVITIAELIIIPLIQAAFSVLVSFVSGLAQSVVLLGKALLVGAKFVGMSLFKGFASFFAAGLVSSGSSATVTSSIVGFVTKSVVGVAVSYGTNAGLSALGVNPVVTRYISAFVTGGILGGLGSVANFFSFAHALGALAIEGVNYFGSMLDLPPPIVSLLSVTAGTLVNGMFGMETGISELFTDIGINLASELAYIGVQELGDFLGIDPRISYIAGIGIRSSLRMGFGAGGGDPGEFANGLLEGAMTGLAQGAAGIGLNYLTEEFNLPPLLANMGFSALSLGIEGLINGSGIFDHIFETYEKNAVTFLGHNPKPNNEDYWEHDPSDMWVFREADYNRDMAAYLLQESIYISQILDFSDIVREQGLVEALNVYATGFFNAIAVNSMVNISGSVGQYIWDKINSADYTLITMDDGSVAKQVDIEDTGESALIGEEDDLEWLKGKLFKGGIVYGDLGVNPNTGELGVRNGYIDNMYDNLLYRMEIDNTQAPSLWIGNDGGGFMQLGKEIGNFFDTAAYAYEFDFMEANISDQFLAENGEFVGISEPPDSPSARAFSDTVNGINELLYIAGEDFENYTEYFPSDFDFDKNITDLHAGLSLSAALLEMGCTQKDDLTSVIKGYKIDKVALVDYMGIDASASLDLKSTYFFEIGAKIYAVKMTTEATHWFGERFGIKFVAEGTLGSIGLEGALGLNNPKLKVGAHWGIGVAGTVELLFPKEEDN